MAGKTVRRFIADLGYVVHTPAELFTRQRLLEGVSDEEWLAKVGPNGWAVFGRDKAILQRPYELEAYRRARLHMFLLPGQATRAKIVELLKVNLRDVCVQATTKTPAVRWLTRGGLVDKAPDQEP